ncbi:MAG TPA: RAMP superfamily CRISPR-associated protein [Anaerolineae bacterium]|jgi:CRISPR-associated protein Cmr4
MNNFAPYRYLLMTTDPVHIGTGGMRLGRVDNSIVREPGTRLPKIPGTSLSGAIRQYAAYRYGKRRCAGQGQPGEGSEGHCGRPTCPICYTFGFVQGENGIRAHSGVVSIGDARLLLFPVYSLAGPVWVTSPGVLGEFEISEPDPGEAVKLPTGLSGHTHLNLGWLLLSRAADNFQWPDQIKEIPDEIKNRAVLVSDKLFSQIVNSNLEVRTSVSINPETGAAEEGALFTYEAIPRAAILWLDVVVDDYRGTFPATEKLCKVEEVQENGFKRKKFTDNAGEPLGKKWGTTIDLITAGLELAEHLGIGGMGTRGFGRVRLLNGKVQ